MSRRASGRAKLGRWLRLGGFDGARRGAARGAARERQQSDVAGPLDGDTQPTLVARTDSRHAARKNFAALLHELGKNIGALVVDQIHLLDAELADFLLAKKLALTAARSAWTTARSAGTSGAAFTASATWPSFATATAVATGSTMTAFAAW